MDVTCIEYLENINCPHVVWMLNMTKNPSINDGYLTVDTHDSLYFIVMSPNAKNPLNANTQLSTNRILLRMTNLNGVIINLQIVKHVMTNRHSLLILLNCIDIVNCLRISGYMYS